MIFMHLPNSRYTFPAALDGVYTYCFSNKMSTMTPKIVMFSMDVGENEKKDPSADAAESEFLLCFIPIPG